MKENSRPAFLGLFVGLTPDTALGLLPLLTDSFKEGDNVARFSGLLTGIQELAEPLVHCKDHCWLIQWQSLIKHLLYSQLYALRHWA